jgi:hypothetical protein
MKKELATLRDHGIVVFTVIVIEWALKGALYYAGEWGFLPSDTAETVSGILGYFMIVSILVFCIRA